MEEDKRLKLNILILLKHDAVGIKILVNVEWRDASGYYISLILMRLCPRLLQLTLLIPLSCISRLVLCSISQLSVMRSDSSLSGRKDTAAPILTPAVRVRGGWFVTTSVCLYASLLQVQAVTGRVQCQELKHASPPLRRQKKEEKITEYSKSQSTTFERNP